MFALRSPCFLDLVMISVKDILLWNLFVMVCLDAISLVPAWYSRIAFFVVEFFIAGIRNLVDVIFNEFLERLLGFNTQILLFELKHTKSCFETTNVSRLTIKNSKIMSTR